MNKKLYFYRVMMWQLTWCGQKLRRHVATYDNVMCHIRLHVHSCVCACVCACVRTHVINENKHPFQSFRYLINYKALINPSNHCYFYHAGLFFYFYAQVMW